MQCVKDNVVSYKRYTRTREDIANPATSGGWETWEEYQEYVDIMIHDGFTEKEFNSLRNPDPRKVSMSEYWLLDGHD